ncbi:hypothetical protein [uncultured Hymenobacter sp.]|uniref:hypothetical protein n=1 Tax=uncultured Hymenobacter sp. TaxID=170016 RepID=UPI0035CAD130
MELREENQQARYDYVGRLMRRGLSDKQVQARLQAKGLAAQQAQILTHHMRSQFREGSPPREASRALALWQYVCQYWPRRLRAARMLARTEG